MGEVGAGDIADDRTGGVAHLAEIAGNADDHHARAHRQGRDHAGGSGSGRIEVDVAVGVAYGGLKGLHGRTADIALVDIAAAHAVGVEHLIALADLADDAHGRALRQRPQPDGGGGRLCVDRHFPRRIAGGVGGLRAAEIGGRYVAAHRAGSALHMAEAAVRTGDEHLRAPGQGDDRARRGRGAAVDHHAARRISGHAAGVFVVRGIRLEGSEVVHVRVANPAVAGDLRPIAANLHHADGDAAIQISRVLFLRIYRGVEHRKIVLGNLCADRRLRAAGQHRHRHSRDRKPPEHALHAAASLVVFQS